MAAPPEVTVRNLSGVYDLDRNLSDDVDPALALQGIAWLLRKAISFATVTQTLTQFDAPANEDGGKEGPSVTHVNIVQTLTGGIKGTTEERVLDNNFRAHEDHIFGALKGRTRFARLSEVGDAENGGKGTAEDKAFLLDGWGESASAGADTANMEVLENFIESDNAGWTAWGTWGVAPVEVNGATERRFVKRICLRKRDDCVRVKLVHNWNGKVPSKA